MGFSSKKEKKRKVLENIDNEELFLVHRQIEWINKLYLEQHYNGIGFAKKELERKIKSYKKFMTAEIEAQGQTFKMNRTESFLSPSCYKAETNAMGMTVQSQVVNANGGGEQNMQSGKKTLNQEERSEIINNARLDKDLLYKENGDVLDLTGIEAAMGEDCYVIKRTNSKGDESTEFYSIDSGLLIQLTKVVTY